MKPPEARTIAFPEARTSLVDAYLRCLPSEATRSTYRNVLTAFEGFLGRELLIASRRDVEAYRAHLEALQRAPSTIAKHLSALSGYYQFAVDEGAISTNPAARARRPKVSDTSPRRALTPSETRRLLQAAQDQDQARVALRDVALVTLLAVQGFRIAEALGLRVCDLAEEQGHKVATVTGKGGKVLRVPLAAGAWSAMQDWIGLARLKGEDAVFCASQGGDLPDGPPVQAISQAAVWYRLRKLAKIAGIERPIHAHLFRHGAATEALAAGVPLHQVQDFMRHADPRTTRRYDAHRHSLANPTTHVLAGKLLDGGGEGE